MDTQTDKYHYSYSGTAFEQRLNDIAWPIKCHWAKHFPIRVDIQEDVEFAAMDYEHVYIHPDLNRFDDNVLFCIMAHEWAHRMVSPKSSSVKLAIIKAVAEALNIEPELAHLVSAPAIELIVDRSNCEIEIWQESYRQGFTESFTFFVDHLQQKVSREIDKNEELLKFNKMMLALRLTNVSTSPLPAYIRHLQQTAENMVAILFEDWNGYDDANDPDHIERIVRFAKAFYAWLPKELLKNRERLAQLLNILLNELGDLAAALASLPNSKDSRKGSPSSTGVGQASEQDETIFDLGLTRQVTDHLMNQAHKARQITGLWQPGHALSKLDLKRSSRTSPLLIPGMTTRRKTDSSRMLNFECGKQLRFCLIVDDSGSMAGDEAKFSRSICEGINRFAALRDMHVGLITFGSSIDVSFQPQRRYQKLTKALSRLAGNLGGTNLLPALQRLSQFVESDRDITHAVLITDASFCDWDDCQAPINEMLSRINMTVLMINCDMPDEILKTLKSHQHAISFFKVDPSQPTNIAILEEIIR